MEAIFDFIFDNIWWLLMLFIFLSGFSKSKKKKGERVDQDLSNQNNYDESQDFDWVDDGEPIPTSERRSVFDNLPIPTELKELMQEFSDEDESPWKRKESYTPPEAEVNVPAPVKPVAPEHYDAPYSGEGKVHPHMEVHPTYMDTTPYSGEGKVFSDMPGLPRNVAAEYSGEGKVRGKSVVKPQVAAAVEVDAYALHPLVDSLKQANIKKLADAVVMAEVLAKPKALRKPKSNI